MSLQLNYSFAQRAQHSFRRLSFQLLHPFRYSNLQNQRRHQTADGYSCRPFDEHRCIFVHIPKCAGISVFKSLFGNLSCGHKSLARYRIMYGPKEFQDYFKFTFVRNPWDRLVSAFFFLKKGGINDSNKKWGEENLARYPDFEAFVRQWVTRKNIRSHHHFRPQSDFICLEKGRAGVDFIGYYENLATDFSLICRKLKLNSTLLEANRNSARKQDYREYYTAETRRIVGEIYAEDIQLLGYTFDNSLLPTQLAARGANPI
jgi:hypothetical protein